MAKQVYRITHHYQIGNQDVFVESEKDPTDAAIYCQFIAETENVSNTISNLGIASALVHFYGCRHAAYSNSTKTIDMYKDRSTRCGEWWLENEVNSPLKRDGLFEYLKPHIDGK